MAAQTNFRSALNGFNRQDVAHYLEYLNSKYQAQVNQLTAENEALRAQLAQNAPEAACAAPQDPALEAACEALTQRVAELEETCTRQAQQITELEGACEELTQRNAELEEARSAALETAAPAPQAAPAAPGISEELAAYRRAERIEREAKERAAQIYSRTNGALAEASASMDALSGDFTGVADQILQQLTQLQTAVTASKKAIQDASASLAPICPNE